MSEGVSEGGSQGGREGVSEGLASLGVLSRSSAMLLFLAGSRELNCSHRSPSRTHYSRERREGTE